MAEIHAQSVEQQKPRFSWGESYARYEQSLTDNDHLKQLRFTETMKDMTWVADLKHGFGYWMEVMPIADRPIFTDAIVFGMVPDAVQRPLRFLFQQRPALLLDLEVYLRQDAGLSQLEKRRHELRDRLYEASFAEVDEIEIQLRQVDQDEATQQHNLIGDWLSKLGIQSSELSEEVTSEIVMTVFQAAEQWRELAYARHLVSEASSVLSQLIPAMDADIRDVADRILVMQPRGRKLETQVNQFSKKSSWQASKRRITSYKPKSLQTAESTTPSPTRTPNEVDFYAVLPANDLGQTGSMSEQGVATDEKGEAGVESKDRGIFDADRCETWWSTHTKDGASALIMPPHIGTKNKQRYAEDVLITVHELLHAVVTEKLGIPGGSHVDWATKTQVVSTLGRTIHEGLSIAAEHLLLTAFERDATESWDRAETFGKERLHYLYRMNRYWSIDRLREIAVKHHIKIPTVSQTGVAYSEGAKLAIALQRNGWTLADLPKLMSEIKTVIKKTTGRTNPKHWARLPVERTKQPPEFVSKHAYLTRLFHQVFAPDYQKIILAIRKLQPS